MGSMHRAQILLEQEQHKALTDIANQENRSMSDLIREIVREYLSRKSDAILWQQRLEAVERLSLIRESIEGKYGVYQGDLLKEARDEREADIDRIWREDV